MSTHEIERLCLSFAMVSALVACDPRDHTATSMEQRVTAAGRTAVDQRPLGHVAEFDAFTLRANVSPSETLPIEMIRQHGIDARPEVFLLNLVVLEKGEGGATPVQADVSVHYESLVGHAETIEMRAVDTEGLVSYLGTLDASEQQIYRIVVEAQPEGTDAPLRMNFEVQRLTSPT